MWMTFKVDLSEVNTLASKIETTSHVLENDLHNVMQQLDELIGLDSFQGDTASHAKKYFENVHQTAIQSIQFIAHELATNMKTHIETFKRDVDSNDHARIEYAYLQEIKENVQLSHTQVGDSVQNISQSLESISDIIDVEPPQMADLETSKSRLDQTIDQLCNDVELFTAKGSEHDEEMKEMLHQVETLMTEAQSQNGEARFTITETSSMNQSLSFLTEANLILENRQADRGKNVIAETPRELLGNFSETRNASMKQVKYAKKPNTIVELSQVIVDVVKGTASAVYHLGEDFVLGIVQIARDLPGTLEALANMISRPIETAKYIGKAINDSFIRDVIHGDAESRSHWFTYAIGSIFGFKGLDKAGKAGVQAAKRGAQKAGQKLDELLPYHPKHQLAVDGPVPYNVYDGVHLRDQLMVKAENVSSKGPKTRLPRTNGKWNGEPGNGVWYSDKAEVQSITTGKGVEFINGRPNFTPWSKGSIKFKKGMLDGTKNDFNLVYEKIMQLKGFKSQNQAKYWLKEKGLTPHHKSSIEIELIPTDLHDNIPHIGSASDLRSGI